MNSLPAWRQPIQSVGSRGHGRWFRPVVWSVLMMCIGALSMHFGIGPGTASGQTAGSSCRPAPTLPLAGTRIVHVATEAQLQQALSNVHGGDTIVLADGTYQLSRTLWVVGVDHVTIRGTSGCDRVVLVGRGMDEANDGHVPHGIWSDAHHTVIAHLTIRDVYRHPIIFNGGAQAPRVYNVKLLNAGEQFIKANPLSATQGIDHGVVEYSVLEYTAGPPQTNHGVGTGYTNGLSLHTAHHWVIRGNLFKNFHTPDAAVNLWNPAVLVWNHSAHTLTERNTFINVDRAVAYGLSDIDGSDHQGGVIRNNFIALQPGLMSAWRQASSDAPIIVWDSPGTKVYHNTILTNGNVVRSIEMRFNTAGAEVRNNLADAPLGARNGGSFSDSGNVLTATIALFVNPSAGDLHLKSTATPAIDQAPTLLSVTHDIDGTPRPFSAGYDVGADEYTPSGNDTVPPAPPTDLTVAPIGGHSQIRGTLPTVDEL